MNPRLTPNGARRLSEFIAEHGQQAADALPPDRLMSWNHVFFILPERDSPDDDDCFRR